MVGVVGWFAKKMVQQHTNSSYTNVEGHNNNKQYYFVYNTHINIF